MGLSQLDLDFGIDWAFDGAAGFPPTQGSCGSTSRASSTNLSLDLTGINLAQIADPAAMQMALCRSASSAASWS